MNEEGKTFEVYKLTNTVNNKIYIGITSIGTGRRYKLHCYKAESGSSYALHQAIREYGKDKFTATILEFCDSAEQLRERERYFIALFDATNPNIGYNTTAGGEYFEVTQEMREALSKAQKGRPHTEAYKAVLQYDRDGNFLREWSNMTEAALETGVSRASMLRSVKRSLVRGSKSNPYIWLYRAEFDEIPDKIDPKTYFKNLDYKPTLSAECEQAIQKYRVTDGDFKAFGRPVTKCDLQGNEIESYESINSAARANGITPAAIRLHLRGFYDYSDPKVLKKMKYIWKYKTEQSNIE
jgi:group I intron endonuclease